MNQGAWYSSAHHMHRVLDAHDPSLVLTYAGREAFAAPAGGYAARHVERQRGLVRDALLGKGAGHSGADDAEAAESSGEA